MTFTLFIVNDAPYGDPDLLVAVSNTQTRITLYDLIGNDTDPDSDPLAVFVDSQPANGFVELSGDGGRDLVLNDQLVFGL